MMHETYRIIAQSRIDEQLREADAWRLAIRARRAPHRSGVARRVLALFPHVDDQRPAPAATGPSLAADGTCRP